MGMAVTKTGTEQRRAMWEGLEATNKELGGLSEPRAVALIELRKEFGYAYGLSSKGGIGWVRSGKVGQVQP